MEKDIKIVKANSEDFALFYELFTKTLLDDYFPYSHNCSICIVKNNPGEALKTNVLTGREPLYVAYINGVIAGYLLTSKANGGVGYGHWLGVDKKFQKRGVASALLLFWEKEELKNGSHALQLWTSKNNIEFYQNRGFILSGEFPDAWWGLGVYFFYKPLRKSDEKNFLREYLKNKTNHG